MASPTKRSKSVRRHKRATAGKARKAEIRKTIRKAREAKIDVL